MSFSAAASSSSGRDGGEARRSKREQVKARRHHPSLTRRRRVLRRPTVRLEADAWIAQAACQQCQRRKIKCDGKRPTCAPCAARNSACVYDRSPNQSRVAALRQQLENTQREESAAQHTLSVLLSAPEAQAYAILRDIRAEGSAREAPSPQQATRRESEVVSDTLDPHGRTPSSSQGLAKQQSQSLSEARSSSLQYAVAGEHAPQSDRPEDAAYIILRRLASSSDPERRALLSRLQSPRQWPDLAAELLTGDVMDDHDATMSDAEGERGRSLPAREKTWLGNWFDRDVFMRVRHLGVRRSPQGAGVHVTSGFRFANLPFSSSLRSNHYPIDVQDEQVQNLFLPVWAMKPIGGMADSLDPFDSIFERLESSIATAPSIAAITGTHAYLGALDSPEVFQRAPLLSQTMASIVHSLMGTDGPATITMYGLMHWYWAIWRWMLDPRPETYRDIPALGRPTPYQLFNPHPRVFDFLVVPALRDLMCGKQNPDVRWLSEGIATIVCEWNAPVEDALAFNDITGELDLTIAARAHIERPEVWTFAPSMRSYLENADSYMTIRQ